MAVTVDELSGSPSYKFADGKLVAIRRLKCDWTDVETLMQELIPEAFSAGSVATNQVGAAFPGNPRLRVFGFSVDPLFNENTGITGTDADGLVTYEHAVATVEYRVQPFVQGGSEIPEMAQEVDPVDLLEHNMDSSGQFWTTHGTGLYWDTDDAAVPGNLPIGKFVGTTLHSVTWNYVTNPNWTALERNKGKVNNAAFTLRGFPYPTETLLYLGYSASQIVMTFTGAQAWKITMRFEAKLVEADDQNEYGGHKHPRPQDGQGCYLI